MSPESPRRRDAERSRTAVLEAAVKLLGERPDAGMEAIAAAAGVTRQTVYAHYSSRDRLLTAVVDRITEKAMAEMDAADIDEGPATLALLRLLDVSWRTFETYPAVLHLSTHATSPEADRTRHEPVAERFSRLIQRGQRAGEFDRGMTPSWLVNAVIALGHAAGEEVAAGRMSPDQVATELRTSVLRLLGASEPTDASSSGGE